MRKHVLLFALLFALLQVSFAFEIDLPGLQDHPAIVYFNNSYYLAYQSWEDGKSHRGEIYIEQFDKDWNSLKRVRVTNNSLYDDSPSLIVVDNLLYLAHVTEISNGNYDIFVKVFKPNLTLVKERKITQRRSIQDSPRLLYVDNHIYMAYQSWEDFNGEIYLAKFDKDLNFIKRVRVTYTESVEDRPSLVHKNGFYITYYSNRYSNYDIFLARLTDDMQFVYERRLSSESSHQSYPWLMHLDGFTLFYASTERGTLGIYMNRYDENWNLIDKSMVFDTVAHERRPSACYDGRNVWVAYVYNRIGGDWNIRVDMVGFEVKRANIANVSIGNIVDRDGDGYYEAFDLLVDADTDGVMRVRVLAKPPNKWSNYFTIRDKLHDPVRMHFSASEFKLSEESFVKIRLELWNHVKLDEFELKIPVDKVNANSPPKNAIIVLSKNPVVGSKVVVFANAEDADGDELYYKFIVKRGCCKYEVKGWSKENYWVWNVGKSDVGVSRVEVWIRDGKHAGYYSYDTRAYVDVVVVDENLPPINLVFIASNTSAEVGDRVVLFAHATDLDNDVLYYRFLNYDNGWKIVQNWSTKNYYVFYPENPGKYRFAVQVVDGKHADFNSYDLMGEVEIDVKSDFCGDWLGCP